MTRKPVHLVGDVIAGMLTPVAGVWRALAAPVARLWRLASLRARVSAGRVPITTQFDGPVRTDGRVRLTLGEYCRLGREVFLETPGGGRGGVGERGGGGSIALGSHVRVNQGTVIVSYASIEIGDDVLIGEYVSIRDADHGSAVLDPPVPMRLQEHRAAPVRIGAGAWIARGACILKGVTIGEGAIVAANSVVTKDVPARAIVGGVPARVLKMRGEADTGARGAAT